MRRAVERTRQRGGFRYIVGDCKTAQATFAHRWRTTHTMSQPSELEFLLVSSDYATVQAVSGGVKKYGAKFVLVPMADAAQDCLNRRKIDGVFVDLGVPGALRLIDAIRKGTSNSQAVIFACVTSMKESTAPLNAGANFLLHKPLTIDSIAVHITIAKELLVRERRRYFRHAVNLPVVLKVASEEQHARMTNLSEGGMAVRTVKPLPYASVLDFAFELALGASIRGKGQVAWTNTEGMAGIILQTFHGKAREFLEAWLTAQEKLGPRGNE
jgi:CheY-like chemotaxis protein